MPLFIVYSYGFQQQCIDRIAVKYCFGTIMMLIACVKITKMHFPSYDNNAYLRNLHYWKYGIQRVHRIYKCGMKLIIYILSELYRYEYVISNHVLYGYTT